MPDRSTHDQLVAQLAERYTAGAAGYAAHWQHMLAPMSAPLLKALPLARARRILDVGCGPGTLIAGILERAPDATVIGIDRSMGMLRRATALASVSYALVDARRLAFPAELFDISLLSFMVFHFPDMVGGLQEIHRMLRPGGMVGLTSFKETPTFEAQRVWAEVQSDMALPETLPVRDLSAVDQGKEVNLPGKVRALLAGAGFEVVTLRVDRMSYQWEPENYLSMRASFGSSGAAFRALDAERQAQLIKAVRERYAQLELEAFRFTPAVITATGRA